MGEKSENILYVVFMSAIGQYSVQAVPTKTHKFDMKRPLPKTWAGMRDKKFADITGVKDAIFCHPTRFICAAASFDGAVQLATLAVENK